MDPGRLDLRVTFLQRPGEGRERGDYAEAFTLWANYRQESSREAAEGGRAQDVESGTLVVRDTAQSRTLTNADRCLILGRDFAIEGVGLPDRRSRMIRLRVSSHLGGA